MRKFICWLSLPFSVISSFGQEITRRDADSMLVALNISKPDLRRIDLLLHLAQYHIFKPGENRIDFDSATVYINQAAALNKTLKSPESYGYQLLTQSYILKEKGQKEEGKKLAEQALSILQKTNNQYYLGRAYYELSGYYDYWNLEELVTRISLVKKAVAAFQQSGKLKNIAESLEMLGDLYVRQEAFSEGIKALKQALATYEEMKYPKVQGVYTLLGEAYLDLNDYGQALVQIQKALKTAHMVNDTSMRLCQINNMMGTLYWSINRKEEALKYKMDALKTAIKYHDEPAIYTVAVGISVNNNHLNRPTKALEALASIPKTYLATLDTTRLTLLRMAYLRSYIVAKDYDKAQSLADSTLSLVAHKNLDYQIRTSLYRLVASCYFYKKQYSQARYYLTKNVEIQKEVPFETALIEDAKIWYKLDSAEGNFRSAFNYFSFLKVKTDSLLSESRLRELQVLGVEYETEMKEDSIRLKDQDIALLTQRNRLQQANLRQATLIKNVTVGGIVLAFIIMGLLYRLYRQKQKTNQKLESQQREITQQNISLQHFLTEKEWLLKEIHHRVKNNLQIVMSPLNSQSAYIDNEPALTAIHDSQHRVHAMSLIHQKLYGGENVSSIDMSVYIREMVAYLSDSFSTGQRIRFECHIEPVELDVSQAVPLGLILNEAITNAIKYAFPDNRSGLVSILLSTTTPGYYLLRISDNGVGMPSPVKTSASLGMSLMQGLSEDLNGSFSIQQDRGTTINISFMLDKTVKRANAPTPFLVNSN